MLAEKFKISIQRIPNHPLKTQINPCWQFEYIKNKKCNKPFGLRTSEIDILNIEPILPKALPPWHLDTSNVSFELKQHISKTDSPHLMLQYTQEIIRKKWSSQLHIYTDGSVIPMKNIAAAAFWVPAFEYKQSKRLAYASSSMNAELAAIILSLYWLEQLNLYTGAVIFSDSLSGLSAIQNSKEEEFVNEILILLTHLKHKGIQVNFEWIPAHCGHNENEAVDYFAKQGLSKQIEIFNKTTYNTEKQNITNKTKEKWQERWTESHSPLKEIHPSVHNNFSISLSRKEEKIIHRLRTGVIGLNEDLQRMGRHENGHCNNCKEIETIQHFLVTCPLYTIPRAMLITETNLTDACLIPTLLKSQNSNTQRALARYVSRTNRLLTN